MEALNEGKPFLKGHRLDARMAELADLIAQEHTMYGQAVGKALEQPRRTH